jgi:DNA-binding CsgD family transcriptional regulator
MAGDMTSERLTKREAQVCDLLMHGLQNKEIAAQLNVSINTTNTLVGKILKKTESANRTQAAVKWALKGQAPARA